MTADLELTILRGAGDVGYVAGFAISDHLIVAAGGTSSRGPMVIASSNARHFETRKTPRELGLRDVLAAGEAVWACGEYGQLARSRDHGATWQVLDTGTDACLFGLTVAADGAVWAVGDRGYAARIIGDKPERVDLGTDTRLTAVYALRDDVIALGGDGAIRSWRRGEVTTASTGAAAPLTALAISRHGTWIVAGDRGFVARSPDGTWFSRVKSGVETDLEAIASLADGRLVAVGDRGQILVSADDGRTWVAFASHRTEHLWSVEPFGGGALIGGDDGLIAKLAPPGDATWAERVNVFGGAKPLDVVFSAGPEGFVGGGLAAYLEAAGGTIAADDAAEDEGHEHDHDHGDDDEDHAQAHEAIAILGTAGDAASFHEVYGAPQPDEAARFFAAVRGRDRWSTFAELRLDSHLLPDVGDHNLFELLVRRDQHAYLGTGLVEAFCGVFCIGSQGNGDTYHLELYEWDGPRQVLHYDHETHAFTGVTADSLDSLVYLAALAGAQRGDAISSDAHDVALKLLRGKIAPTWQFAIHDKDPEFVALEPRRRDTELFFYRSQWIVALLKNDGVTTLDDLPKLFMADFNQVVPDDQLPARLDACEKFIPTALYSIWRAYLFDEPELERYLAIGRSHKARLVRDAAALVDQLRAGRNELGTIHDVGAYLDKFRALVLDPRHAEQRKLELEARAKADAVRKVEALAELARTAEAGWADLAWRWLGDGVAHRALLERLDQAPAFADQIVALDALRAAPASEREITVPRLAGELAPELEALLVGSLVRGDDLALPGRPAEDDIDDDGGESPGWEAIDRALAPIYGKGEPHAHYGTVVPYQLGGSDPIHGISVYLATAPVPHFHFVTYGFSDLFAKETDDPEISGFGFELTLRLRRAPDETEVPAWALNFLQNLGRYVFGSGNRFAAGHKMGLNGPIALGEHTKITAILFADDPQLGELHSPFGSARFVQIVGITDDEYRLIQEWSTTGLVEILARQLPVLVTDLARSSVLDDPVLGAEVRRRVEAEGSSEDLTFAGDMAIEIEDGRVRIELGALYAASLPRAMRGRIRHDRPYSLRGRDRVLALQPGAVARYEGDSEGLVLVLPPAIASEIETRMRAGLAGHYRFETWPALEIVVTPSFIRNQQGEAIEVRGVADPDEAAQMIADENARAAAEGLDEGDVSDEDDELEDDERDLPPEPTSIAAALAMTERALQLAPDDADAQFTHAMLLLDGDRAGLAGKADELLRRLPEFEPSVRINVTVRMAKLEHARFIQAVDAVLAQPLPGKIVADRVMPVAGAALASYGDVAEELLSELGEAILEYAPDRMTPLAPLLPPNVDLLSSLGWKAIQADQRDHAIALYDRLLALPIPEQGDSRTNYLRALNNACVQAHAAKAYDTAVRIADRAQPVAHENPYIYHSAACAYAAVGDYAKAFEQVKLAMAHDYDHLNKVEVDGDLGPILEWPEFKALFRDWHSRQGSN